MEKRLTLLAALIFALASLSSCSSDDDEQQGPKHEDVNLSTGETYSISTGGNWQSAEPLIASVSGNIVTAQRVGTTTISSESSSFQLTVNPRYNLYDTPCLQWGASPSYVNTFMDGYNMLKVEGNIVMYDGKGGATSYAYLFENNRLKSSAVLVDAMAYGDALVDYLTERYIVIDVNESENYVMMVNIEQDMALMISFYVISSNLYSMVLYTSIDSTESRTRNSVSHEMEHAIKELNIGKPIHNANTNALMQRFIMQ